MPQLGESIVEGTVARWLVKEGARVERGQAIAEVETDKATNEIPAPVAGVIGKLLVAEGVTVKVGTELLRYAEGEGGAEAGAAAATSAEALTARPARGPGSPTAPTVRPTAPIAAVSAPVPAPAVTTARPVPPSDRLPTRHLAARVYDSAGRERVNTPAVRRLARARDVDLALVQGTGRHGRVTREDVLAAAAATPGSAPISPAAAPATPAFKAYRPAIYAPQPGDKVVPFNRRRTLIAEHMRYSLDAAAHVAAVVEIDMSQVVKARAQAAPAAAAAGVKLTFTAYVARAVATALGEHPALNASVVGDAHVWRRDKNVGVAVDTKDGLVVPVIHRADELSLLGLARALEAMAAKARAGTLTAADLSGGSFTISNPGRDGNLFGVSIIRQPEVAILRTGEITKRAVVRELAGEDAIVIRPIMFAALSYDHRVIDGATGNAFLHRIRALLEQPQPA